MSDLELIRSAWSHIVAHDHHRQAVTPSDPLALRDSNQLMDFKRMLRTEMPGCEFEFDGDTLTINGTIGITP